MHTRIHRDPYGSSLFRKAERTAAEAEAAKDATQVAEDFFDRHAEIDPRIRWTEVARLQQDYGSARRAAHDAETRRVSYRDRCRAQREARVETPAVER